jgi:hypothetical protein
VSSDVKIVSPVDHVMEPPDLWVTRIPKRYHDVGPRVVRARGKTSIVDSEFLFVEDDEGTEADCFRSRLGPMLASSRGKHLAEKLDTALVAGALDQVEAAARRMEENPPDIAPSPPIAGVTV